MSSRTLYNHFESKEALFEAISQIILERNRSMEPVPFDPDRDFVEHLKEALWRYIGVIAEETAIELNRMVISELIRYLDRSRQLFTETATHDYPITRLISEAMDAGVIRRVYPVFATNQLLALVKNFFFWPEFFLGKNPTPKDVLDDCVAMFQAHDKARRLTRGRERPLRPARCKFAWFSTLGLCPKSGLAGAAAGMATLNLWPVWAVDIGAT